MKKYFTWLRILVITLLVIGIFFRFVNLGKKVYWGDETLTSLQVAGYTRPEYIQEVFGHLIAGENLQDYQRVTSKRSLTDTVKSLAIDTPEHPPLYYVMARLWIQCFGNSVATIRSLSALLSLLVFPGIYWLCRELFESSLIGWIGMALIAVSPFHLLYAQEAREYSLWTGIILLSSAALLRAMQHIPRHPVDRIRNWSIYAVMMVLGLYSHVFFGFVVIGNCIYVAAIEGFRLTKNLVNFVLASLTGIVIFSPWIFRLVTNHSQAQNSMGWIDEKASIFYLIDTWLVNISRVFIDFIDIDNYFPNLLIPNLALGRYSVDPFFIWVTPILILVVYSLYFCCRNSPKRIWLFILTLIGVTELAVILPDLIVGGQRSSIPRYQIPCYLGIELAVAYLLGTQISSISLKKWQPYLWRIVAFALISGGVLSCTIISQAEAWWNKQSDYVNPPVARIINQSPNPLVIVFSDLGRELSLSYLVHPKVHFLVILDRAGVSLNIPKITDGFSDIFLFNSSEALRLELNKNYKIEPIPELHRFQNKLFRLEKYNHPKIIT